MNLKENLLVTVSEECSEVEKAIAKALRFGLTSRNTDEIMREFYHICAMIEMCQDANALPIISDMERNVIMADKKDKVRHFQKVSQANGTLVIEEDANDIC